MSRLVPSDEILLVRIAKVQAEMRRQHVDAIILPVGAETRWLIDYDIESEDQYEFLVIRQEGRAVYIVSELGACSLRLRDLVFNVHVFGANMHLELFVANNVPENSIVAVGARMWAGHLLTLQKTYPLAVFLSASKVMNPVRALKDVFEIECLKMVATAVDETIHEVQTGAIPLRGRTEKDVAADVAASLKRHGHETVDFTIIAYGANAADPHHVPDDTVIGDGIVLFDIGGSMNGYRSDTTRCVHVGPAGREIDHAYETLREAQHMAVASVRPGVASQWVDSVATQRLIEGGYERYPHGLGHGIGLATHEAPNISRNSGDIVTVGQVFSIEPGIYVNGHFGMRIEDIVVVTEHGAERLNKTSDELIELP